MKIEKNSVLILDNIRSALNVGAIFRTAEAAGVSKIFLVGITPSPVDRFGRERKDVAKAALGAEKMVPWEQVSDIEELLGSLKSRGVKIISLEQDARAVDYRKISVGGESALVLGNEVTGVSREALDLSDLIVEIQMRGRKESLNVSVAAGIALFRLFNT